MQQQNNIKEMPKKVLSEEQQFLVDVLQEIMVRPVKVGIVIAHFEDNNEVISYHIGGDTWTQVLGFLRVAEEDILSKMRGD